MICGRSITLRQKISNSGPLIFAIWYLEFAPVNFAWRATMKTSIAAFRSEPARSALLSFAVRIALALGAAVALPAVSLADENGVSFWLPGLFGSLVAVPAAAWLGTNGHQLL